MQNTEKVHALFRGASEVRRFLQCLAVISDICAAGIGLFGIFAKPTDTGAWLPLLLLTFAALGSFLRAYSSAANSFAQRCRRISLRAFCNGNEVDTRTVSYLDDDSPPFVEAALQILTTKTLDEYYEPTTPPGPAREAELYAHSAFFTWRLLRAQSILLLILGLSILAGCGLMVYQLAASLQLSLDRHSLLESICTIILLAFSMRSLEASWDAHTSSNATRSIENALLELPSGTLLRDLTDSYDLERAAGANPMTLIYRALANHLSAKWRGRRRCISA